MNPQEEIERFKEEINLPEFAASLGYSIDVKESSRNSLIMRLPLNNDKIVIAKKGNLWCYFSVRDSQDNGSIIDFIQHRFPVNLGEVRKMLRPWLLDVATHPPVPSALFTIEPTYYDQLAVQQSFSTFRACSDQQWLSARGISPETMLDPRFFGCIFEDRRHNAIFPHSDKTGITGFEIRNSGFYGFAKHGQKTVWRSKATPYDSTLVLTESALDALSLFQLRLNERFTKQSTYFSIGGQFSPDQFYLLKDEILSLQPKSYVILAFDHDDQGNIFADLIRDIVPGHFYERIIPDFGKDWNEQLTHF